MEQYTFFTKVCLPLMCRPLPTYYGKLKGTSVPSENVLLLTTYLKIHVKFSGYNLVRCMTRVLEPRRVHTDLSNVPIA